MLNTGMKRIRSLLTAAAVLILIGAMINLGYSSPTRLYVDPPNVLGAVGGTLTVDIMVEDVENLFTWQVLMTWSSSALTCNSVVYGDFMQQPRSGSYMTSDAVEGEYDVYVINPSYYSASMNVLIYDDSNSETNQIASIIGTKLTMQTALQHTYTVADHGKVDTYPGTTPSGRIETGWLMAGEMTSVSASGAYGSGWLATIEFQVLSETACTLDISTAYPASTYLLDNKGLDILCTAEDGHYVLPWSEDMNVDGMIDIFDVACVGIHWGETGSPGWIREDVNDDGVIDIEDLSAISIQFGEHYAG